MGPYPKALKKLSFGIIASMAWDSCTITFILPKTPRRPKLWAPKKDFQHHGTFILRDDILDRSLFEVVDSSNQHVDELRLEISIMKESQVTNQTFLTYANERILRPGK